MKTQNISYHTFETCIGTMILGYTESSITHLTLARRPDGNAKNQILSPAVCSSPGIQLTDQTTKCCLPLVTRAISQITEYLEGKRQEFTLPLAPQGTPFQQAVWRALRTIPYGETRCYSEIAQMVGNPKACRAVGMANNRNPIIILIPCHRVVGKNGSLVGYAGGLDIKEKLLELEGARI
ncbi:methylated-DNA--[protein]-cysteine S-methyltransferase [Roseburia hominis]